MPKHEEKMKEQKDDVLTGERIKSFQKKGMSERDAVIKGLTSMKRKSSDTPTAASHPMDHEEYPYGLKLNLETEDLDKLGLSELPAVGKECKITAQGVIESASTNQSKGDAKDRKSISIQITAMKLVPVGGPKNTQSNEAADEKTEDTGEDY